jgi:hypothetical protein
VCGRLGHTLDCVLGLCHGTSCSAWADVCLCAAEEFGLCLCFVSTPVSGLVSPSQMATGLGA